jgi:hypothetical protein
MWAQIELSRILVHWVAVPSIMGLFAGLCVERARLSTTENPQVRVAMRIEAGLWVLLGFAWIYTHGQ